MLDDKFYQDKAYCQAVADMIDTIARSISADTHGVSQHCVDTVRAQLFEASATLTNHHCFIEQDEIDARDDDYPGLTII